MISLILVSALTSICVMYTASPFMSLMFAICLYINGTLMLLMLGFEFMSLINILVYVGALAVLFLFVVMLLELPTTILFALSRGINSLLGILVVATIIAWSSFNRGLASVRSSQYMHKITHEMLSSAGEALYAEFADALIINSIILTVALIGALALAERR